jgi:hypothetical protein
MSHEVVWRRIQLLRARADSAMTFRQSNRRVIDTYFPGVWALVFFGKTISGFGSHDHSASSVTLSIGALIVGVFFTIWAVRGWQEGVIVGSSEVTIRNLTSTRKVALGNISSFTLKPSRHKAFVVALVESDGSLKKLPFWSPSMISDDPRNRRFRDFVDQLSNAVKTAQDGISLDQEVVNWP